jgi:hypothetical protein
MLRGTPATAKPTSMRSNSTVSVAARPDYRAFGLRNGSFAAEIDKCRLDAVQTPNKGAQVPNVFAVFRHLPAVRRPEIKSSAHS